MQNRDDILELFAKINELLLQYPNANLVVDDNGAGKGLGQYLKSKVFSTFLFIGAHNVLVMTIEKSLQINGH